uniref:Putative secreted protein n=1 Tax=Ixodes ricinus TaxID=34613 RepID=A0A6B0U190_IXORI
MALSLQLFLALNVCLLVFSFRLCALNVSLFILEFFSFMFASLEILSKCSRSFLFMCPCSFVLGLLF